ncbi:MAG: efflux RND transporter periplasmic adaptor subunit [Steroidobacteraceae bacterium]
MNVSNQIRHPGVLLLSLLAALAGCGDGATDKPVASVRAMPVTVIQARRERVEVVETTVGTLEALTVPTVAAETAGRIVKVLHDAGDAVESGAVLAVLDAEEQRSAVAAARAAVQRLEALADNQDVNVGRLQDLAKRQSVSQSLLDEAIAQQRALRAQQREAEAKLEEAARALRMTEIRSPTRAVIQRRLVSVGSYVAVGDPAFELVVPGLMRALLPFPEGVVGQLRVGQLVRLESPGVAGESLEAKISELRPMVGTNNRSVDAITAFANPGGWRSGSSVTARVVVDARDAIVVPTAAVVQRPAGMVVYTVKDNVAHQRVVRIGVVAEGSTEVMEGLQEGEVVAAEGAGFLTDGTPVTVRKE